METASSTSASVERRPVRPCPAGGPRGASPRQGGPSARIPRPAPVFRRAVGRPAAARTARVRIVARSGRRPREARRDGGGVLRLGIRQPGPQRLGDRAGRGIAFLRVLLEAGATDPLQPRWHVAAQRSGAGHRLGRDDRGQDRGERISPDRWLAGQQGVQQAAQRVDVGAGRDRPASPVGLLGCHVVRRAQDLVGRRLGMIGVDGVKDLGQAEVRHVRPALGVEQHVGRLQVPVDHAAGMGVLDRPSHHRHQRCDAVERDGPLSEQGGECRPVLDQVHDQEVSAVGHPADAVHADNVRVPQPRQRPRLGEEPPHPRRRIERLIPDQLERHSLAQALLDRLVHLAHPARAERAHQLEIGSRQRRVQVDGEWRRRSRAAAGIRRVVVPLRRVATPVVHGGWHRRRARRR